MAGGYYAPRRILSKQALPPVGFFPPLLTELLLVGGFLFLYLNRKYWVASHGLGTEFSTSILLGAAGTEKSVIAPVQPSALHTLFPTGDPALFSQPNHKRPDSGSDRGAPPPPPQTSQCCRGGRRARQGAEPNASSRSSANPRRAWVRGFGARLRVSPSYFPFFCHVQP